MMEAVRTSETTVHSNEKTWHYIPKDSKLHTRRREKLKSHIQDSNLKELIEKPQPYNKYSVRKR
jgi:hypothetical protein